MKRHPDPGVGDPEHRLVVRRRQHHRDPAAVGSELHCVAQQVDHDPFEHFAIAGDHDRGRRQVQADIEHAGRLPRWCQHLVGRLDGLTEVECLEHRLDAVLGHPGEREEVVDQGEQPVAVGRHALKGVVLPRVHAAEAAVAQQLEIAQDARDRRTQLVADGRDERVLDGVHVAQPFDRAALHL